MFGKMAKSCFIFVGVVVLSLGAYAATEEEVAALRAAVRPLVEDCAKEYGITTDQLLAVKKTGNIDLLNPCFYECFFKKIEFIDAKGLFDSSVAVEKNKKYFKDVADIQKAEHIGNTCLSVNKEAVSDGEKACERSKLLLACFLKEKANFTLFQFQ